MAVIGLVVIVLVALFGLALGGCHGHLVRERWVPNHAVDFDFSAPPCEPSVERPPAGAGDVLVRYLGVGGVQVEWRNEVVLTAPFFSNHGPLRVGFGAVGWDENAIREGLAGGGVDRTGAVLVGHSHYDHLADLPPVLTDLAPDARVYVNRSGIRMLAGFDGLEERCTALEDRAGRPFRLEDRAGRELPFRVLAVPSTHAPHLGRIRFAKGEVREPWDTWTGKRLRRMREGAVFAFELDLLDEDGGTAFRIHYQDASGIPSSLPEDREVDLAILCMPSHWLVDGYPERVLEETRARHVMIIHYEDFLRPRDRPLRFVVFLTNARAEAFLRALDRHAAAVPPGPGPRPCTCGPCGEAWTMPMPGEWLRFPR